MKEAEHGFVLVCVLWVLVILTIVTLSFGRDALLERRAASYALDHAQALSMARGAVMRGMMELRNKAALDGAQSKGVHTSFDQTWHIHPSVLDEKLFVLDADLQGTEPVGGVKDVVDFVIRDEQAFLSVNQAPEDLLDEVKVLGVRGVGAILRERDAAASAGKKQRFMLLEELLTLDGIPSDAWRGGQDKPGLRDLMTCWGDGPLNINTASREVLALIPDLNERVIDSIVTYRAGPDGQEGTSDDRGITGLDELTSKMRIPREDLTPLYQYCMVDSRFFTITGFATLRRGKIRASCSAVVEVKGEKTEIRQWREDMGAP